MEDDIVTMLHQNGVAHLVEEIFNYLDYSDIKSATQVSRNWRHHLLTNSRVWKSLWDRNIAHLPIWNSLYKRALYLQTIPEGNPQEACKAVGNNYQKVLRNVQQGRYTEQVDTFSKSFMCEIGSNKVVTAGKYSNQIHVQNRWRENEEARSFDITHPTYEIRQLEINEPYLIAVAYRDFTGNFSVSVFDLEKEKKIHEFKIRNTNGNLSSATVKCNDQVLITCCEFSDDGSCSTVLTARQMPCSAHPETDFPVIGELNIPEIIRSIFLEDQRIVLIKNLLRSSNFIWTATVFIISMKPLRIIRQHQFTTKFMDQIKYWNGWLLQSDRKSFGDSDKCYSHKIKLTNIDTEEDKTLNIKHLNFDIVNNHLVTFSESDSSLWKFQVFNLPLADVSKDLNLLCSFQLRGSRDMDRDWECYEWKIRFDGVQLWLCLCKQNSINYATLAVRDYTKPLC